MTKKNAGNFNFEKALEELEQLVTAMEDGELTLEQSLQAFEKGIKLTRECQSALQEAEQKVQVLLNEEGDTGELETGDLESHDSASNSPESNNPESNK